MVNEPEQNYKTGYIKIYRSLKNHWIWGKGKKSHFEAWIDLLLMASHTGLKEPIGYDLIIIKQGQVLTSQEKLSLQWRWDRNAVRKFLQMLSSDGMISVETFTKYTMITICKYDSYQTKKPTKHQQEGINATSTQHQEGTYNNENNYNNDNNVLPLPKNERFEKFEIWINENAPRVAKLEKPITEDEFLRLVEKYQLNVISDNLIKMHNYKPLLKNNVSANLTLINWIERDRKY